jgi:glycosyltransferase involved in cell wall biosynthesis
MISRDCVEIYTICSNYNEYVLFSPTYLLIAFGLGRLGGNPDVLASRTLSIAFPSITLMPRHISSNFEKMDIIHCEQPWAYSWAREELPSIPILICTQNVESDLLYEQGDRHYQIGREVESQALREADGVVFVSKEDKRAMELYGLSKQKCWIVPNGADTKRIQPTNENDRQQNKKQMGLGDQSVCLFFGSGHEPNVEAAEFLCKIAVESDLTFLIAGSVGDFLSRKAKNRRNVIILGRVSDPKIPLGASDIALNPVISGSGSNLKNAEYLAAGLPIVTTVFGARGMPESFTKASIVTNRNHFLSAISTISSNPDLKTKLGKEARKIAEKELDWEILSKKLRTIDQEILD